MENQEKRIQLEVNDYVKIEIIGLVRTVQHSVCGVHRHPFWELIYTKSGEGMHQFSGQQVTLGKDEICLIAPGVLHDCKNERPEDNLKLYIGFSYHYSLYKNGFQQKPFVTGSISHLPALLDQFAALCDIMDQKEISTDDFEVGGIISMIAQVIRIFSGKNTHNPNLQDIRTQNLVKKVKDYLKSNLCRSIKLEELGSMFYLSPHYISDSFRKTTGMSVKQYHDLIRMRYASQLLEETELSVSEISERLGFDSIHYFSRRYKERYGFSPSAVRGKKREHT